MSPLLLCILILGIAGAFLYSRKDWFKSLPARNQFLILVLCYFAVPVLSSNVYIFSTVNHFPGFQEFLKSNSLSVNVFFRLLNILILVFLLVGKGYITDRKSRIGLLLIIIGQALPLILMIIENTTGSYFNTGSSLLYTSATIMRVAGVLLFIFSSASDRDLKILLISAMVVPGLLYTLLQVAVLRIPGDFALWNSIGNFIINLGLLITACILGRKAMMRN